MGGNLIKNKILIKLIGSIGWRAENAEVQVFTGEHQMMTHPSLTVILKGFKLKIQKKREWILACAEEDFVR